MGLIQLAEHRPDWRLAHRRLVKASDYLDSLSHLPKDDPKVLKAHAAWMGAKIVYDAVLRRDTPGNANFGRRIRPR